MTEQAHTTSALSRATKSGIIIKGEENIGDLWKRGFKAAVVDDRNITMIGIPQPDQSLPGHVLVQLFYEPEYGCLRNSDWDGMRYVAGA